MCNTQLFEANPNARGFSFARFSNKLSRIPQGYSWVIKKLSLIIVIKQRITLMITIIIIKITYINNGDNNDDNNNDKTNNKSPLHQVVSNLHFFNHPSTKLCCHRRIWSLLLRRAPPHHHLRARPRRTHLGPQNGCMAPGGEGLVYFRRTIGWK